jgi:hypothetical protein
MPLQTLSMYNPSSRKSLDHRQPQRQSLRAIPLHQNSTHIIALVQLGPQHIADLTLGSLLYLSDAHSLRGVKGYFGQCLKAFSAQSRIPGTPERHFSITETHTVTYSLMICMFNIPSKNPKVRGLRWSLLSHLLPLQFPTRCIFYSVSPSAGPNWNHCPSGPLRVHTPYRYRTRRR